jgi:hypothetical protein
VARDPEGNGEQKGVDYIERIESVVFKRLGHERWRVEECESRHAALQLIVSCFRSKSVQIEYDKKDSAFDD